MDRLFFFVAVVVLASAAANTAPAEEPDDQTPACIDYWGEARWSGYGFDHVVHVQNGCEKLAQCVVSTDVSPDVVGVAVPPGEKANVLTMRGSPSREFTPYVRCQLTDDDVLFSRR